MGAAMKLLPYLDWEVDAGWLSLAQNQGPSAGQVFEIGTGPRLQRPRKYRWSPWLDAEALYVRTGSLDRFGYTVGAGVRFALPTPKPFWLGPSVRYLQVVQTSEAGFDTRDARILIVGFSAEGLFGSHPPPPPPPQLPPRPRPAPPADSDGDGVLDKEDRCPAVPGSAENGGCPDVDTDADGVVDRLDRCPREPGPRSNDGCPLPDRDKDGVPDAEDSCPDTPGPPENHGCPVYKLVTVTAEKIELGQKVLFAFGTTAVTPKTLPLLQEVADAMRDHAALHVRIEGHTDSVGTTRRNLALSAGRAEAILQILVDDGVSADRLEAVGYGSTLPIDTNATVAGREANRRVEFVITAGAPKPPSEPPGVPAP